MRSAILFFSHLDAPGIRRTYGRLKAAAEKPDDVYWLFDASVQSVPETLENENVWSFSLESLNAALAYPHPIRHIVPGFAHAPVIAFALDHPSYDAVWLIEYDVRFTGDWAAFFAATRADRADLLTTRLRRYADEKSWYFWDSLRHPTRRISRADRLVSFNPIYRISREGLRHLHAAHREGWQGHNEVLLPTLLADGGFRVADLSGQGPFGAAIEHGFYTTGTIKWRPPRWRSGSRPNTLYHPVKPFAWFVSKAFRWGRGGLDRVRGGLRRRLSRRPARA